MSPPTVLENLTTGDLLYDTLKNKADRPYICGDKSCLGALMNQKPKNKPIPETEILPRARDFYQQYKNYQNEKNLEFDLETRLSEVESEIYKTGTYQFQKEELQWGLRTAWRNAARCPARVQWSNLHMFDKRHVETADEMFVALCQHIAFSTNGGNIKPSITVFRQRMPGEEDLRVWNGLMIGYAGYEMEDGTVIGDKGAIGITKFAQSLGWEPEGGTPGHFDILPMILSGTDGVPHWYIIPPSLIIIVDIKHPTIKAISDLNLKWFGMPSVSGMMAELGGIQFPGAPFTGWYTVPEIGVRDLLDPQRYDMLVPIGKAIGLDTNLATTFWKDRVSVEMNTAVLYSYQEAGVTIVDQYTQADQYLNHFKSECEVRGGCPADWVWIIPPVSGSLVSTYHQEMTIYHLTPSYEYQDRRWETYQKRKVVSLKGATLATKFVLTLYKKQGNKRKVVDLVYATETGTAKKFAKMADKIFSTTFQCNVIGVTAWDLARAADMTIFVTSTFGNGDPPTMALEFTEKMEKLLETASTAPLKDLSFGVFGLGSSAYPTFVGYGKWLDKTLGKLGGKRVTTLGIGDELTNQDGCFKVWAKQTFLAVCAELEVDAGFRKLSSAIGMLGAQVEGETGHFKWDILPQDKQKSLNDGLSEAFSYNVMDLTLKERKELHSDPSEPQIYQLGVAHCDATHCVVPDYEPGDHLGVFPRNADANVEIVKAQLKNLPPDDAALSLLTRPPGFDNGWLEDDKFPKGLTINQILYYFADISSVVPSQDFILTIASYATDPEEKEKLSKLTKEFSVYSKWRMENVPSISRMFQQFPSLKIDSAMFMSQVPLIKPRRYSIASSPGTESWVINLVVGMVSYTTPSGHPKLGLSTEQLSTMPLNTSLPGFHRTEKGFRLPADATIPVILCAAGSGISPFRGFWQVRNEQMEAGKRPGATYLYYGCRNKGMDILSDETDALNKSTLKFERKTAYSREEDLPKKYVQDLMLEDGETIYKLLERDSAAIYVCGKIIMADGIRKALHKIYAKYGNQTEEAAVEKVLSLKKNGVYQEDIFGTT